MSASSQIEMSGFRIYTFPNYLGRVYEKPGHNYDKFKRDKKTSHSKDAY